MGTVDGEDPERAFKATKSWTDVTPHTSQTDGLLVPSLTALSCSLTALPCSMTALFCAPTLLSRSLTALSRALLPGHQELDRCDPHTDSRL